MNEPIIQDKAVPYKQYACTYSFGMAEDIQPVLN